METVPFTARVDNVVDLQPLRQQVDHFRQRGVGHDECPAVGQPRRVAGRNVLRLGARLGTRLRAWLSGLLLRRRLGRLRKIRRPDDPGRSNLRRKRGAGDERRQDQPKIERKAHH